MFVWEVGRIQYWLLHRIVSPNVGFFLDSTEGLTQRPALIETIQVIEATFLVHWLVSHVPISRILDQFVSKHHNALLETL